MAVPDSKSCLLLPLVLLFAASSVSAKEKKEAKDGKNGKSDGKVDSSAIHRVEAAPFRVEVEIEGVVESLRETPVAFDLERWSDLTVVRAAPHGKAVEKGDVLIELETEELERKIEELEAGMPDKELELAQLEREVAELEESTPVKMEKERRETERAREELTYFEEVARAMRERDAKENVEDAVESLAYAEEELRQLEKMYSNDGLTEETEEIILRRARHTVERSRWRLEQTEMRAERLIEATLPREHERLKSTAKLESIDWRTKEESLRADLAEKRLDLEEKRRELEESGRELAEYEQDLGDMTARAPHDGIVYYGMSQRGKWTTAAAVERKLIPGGSLSGREIAMTVVDPDRLRVRLSVPEKKLTDLEAGQPAELSLAWKPEPKLEAEVDSVSHVPLADNRFDATAALRDDLPVEHVTPGMKATAEVLVYESEEAVTVPPKAVEEKDDRETVTLANGEERTVETGRSDGKRVEILEGLEAGDRIRLPGGKGDGKKGESSEEE